MYGLSHPRLNNSVPASVEYGGEGELASVKRRSASSPGQVFLSKGYKFLKLLNSAFLLFRSKASSERLFS